MERHAQRTALLPSNRREPQSQRTRCGYVDCQIVRSSVRAGTRRRPKVSNATLAAERVGNGVVVRVRAAA